MMTDRYSEGYEKARKWYTHKFNMRNGLLADTAHQWDKSRHSRATTVIRKAWPELAKQLDLITEEAATMTGEPR